MTEQRAPLVGSVALLERALSYTLGSLLLVTDDALANPTPCSRWDLRALLVHMNDSLAALHEAGGWGEVGPYVERVGEQKYDASAAALVGSLRDLGCTMLGTWADLSAPRDVDVEGRHLTGSVVAAAGALEITVHGWDVAQACGHGRRLPNALAEELLELGPVLVTEADRPARFGVQLATEPGADAASRLLAFLGRAG